MKHILITNDDGVHAPGLRALAAALRKVARVTVIAPLTEQSATSHALTIHRPLRIQRLEDDVLAVEGTPTDCVLLAVREFLDTPADLVVSGINHGPNLGEDVLYSGTVAAAMEGALLGVPAMAMSLAGRGAKDFEAAAAIGRQIATRLMDRDLPPKFLLNVNVPGVGPVRGLRLCRLGSRVYNDAIIRKTDPRGRDYYWIGGKDATWSATPDSDFGAVQEGYVSLTPLSLDLTDASGFEFLSGLEMETAIEG